MQFFLAVFPYHSISQNIPYPKISNNNKSINIIIRTLHHYIYILHVSALLDQALAMQPVYTKPCWTTPKRGNY